MPNCSARLVIHLEKNSELYAMSVDIILEKTDNKDRPFDLILFGATGFTGHLIARYLSEHADTEQITWAIAGRNADKLQAVRADMPGSKPEVVVADVNDPHSLRRMAGQTRVLMNAVGPFNRYGRGVVEACIAEGTHYLDITGEPSFVAEIYNELFESARHRGVCIVNCCGFDSIPADYAAWLTARALPVAEPKKLVTYLRTNASFSGGTLNTAIHAMHLHRQKKSVKTRIPRHAEAPRVPLAVHYNDRVGAWGIPMPVVDPHIVRRSAYRLPADYGVAVGYGQFFLRSSRWKVFKTLWPIAVAWLLVRFRWFRDWMERRFPPGDGPEAEQRAQARFEVICLGASATASAQTRFAGGDPGYDETAKMFSQAAFCLLEHLRTGSAKSGVLTPVEAFGMPLVDRLRAEGLEIELG